MPAQQHCARFWLARLARAAFALVAVRLSGSIVDPSGAAVPGAATPIGRPQARDQSPFTIPGLPPGSDALAVTAQVSTTVTNAQISRLPMCNRSPLGLIITPSGRSLTTGNGMRQSAVSVWRQHHHHRRACLLVALSALLIGLGNGYFHYSPDNQTLFWDRLPMTLDFLAVFSSEHRMPISADQDYRQARVTRDIVVLIVGAPNARLRVRTADMKQEIRCYDYVNHPYENVRNPLPQDPIAVFRAATMLFVDPLTPTETQLDFAGVYEPPLPPLGGLLNAADGHRIADLSPHRFVTSVAEHLRQTAR